MSKLIHFSLLFAATLSLSSSQLTGDELPCRLTWVPSFKFPTNVIEANGDPVQQVIRGKFEGRQDYVTGRFDPMSERIYLPSITQEELNITSEYEFLTNPENCTVEWVTYSENVAKLAVAVLTDELATEKTNVARSYDVSTKLWYSGTADVDSGTVYIPTDDGETAEYRLTESQVLISYSTGIEMEIVDFDFGDPDAFGGKPDFVGMDEIHNDGPGSVSLKIEHKKLVRETYTITVSKTWTSTYTKTFTVRILFWKIQKTTSYTTSRTETESRTTVEETEISVSHEVVVPPYTSVQACSTIEMSENKAVRYTAKAKYRAKGMTPEEVADILNKENIGVRVENNEVIRDVDGDFQAALAMNTMMSVLPLDARLGCSELALLSNERKRVRANGTYVSVA